MTKLITILLISLSMQANQIIEISELQESDLGVKTQKATKVEHVKLQPYNGIVMIDKKDIISVSSNIESIVKDIYVSDFEYVKKGQKLLMLKSNALLSIQKDYIQAILENDNVTKNYARDLKLEEEGIISKKRLLESKTLKDSQELKVKLGESQLLTNGFTSKMLDRLKTDARPIVKQNIYASKSGVVYKVNVNVGEFVQAEHMMLGIYADSKRYIELSVPVKAIENISIGDKCTFSKYSATITAIGNIVNTASQSVQVRAEIQNPQGIMINRVYGVKIQKKVKDAVKIKKSALVFEENNSYVFKKVAQGFEVVSVKVISEGPVCYIIKADISEGDLLAISSTAALLSAMDSEDE